VVWPLALAFFGGTWLWRHGANGVTISVPSAWTVSSR
jgi:hypothetical protein